MRRSIQNFALAILMLGSGMAFGQEEPLDQRDRGMQQFRFPDQRGINDFEALEDDQPFDGVKVRVGGGFALQFQGLDHSNGVTDTAIEPLSNIGSNFNLPTANLNLDVALADGVRAHISTYLSSRNHAEAWVKGGYIQVSSLDFIQEDFLAGLMDITTVKVGMMEVNYGDYHFRRTDNGRAIYNPFVGNLITDAFTTEPGVEVYFTPGDFIIMGGLTNGKLNQSVSVSDNPDVTNGPAFLGKLGYDREVNDDFRVRLTSSIYTISGASRNLLYSGDRAGARFYGVMDEGAFSGRVNPNFSHENTAIMINPFLQYKGLEFFGTIEMANGKSLGQDETRSWNQYHGELLYRFGADDNIYVGGKYNVASGELSPGMEVSVNRVEVGAGWYMTKNLMLKAEYVQQNYVDYPETTVYYDGQFSGVVAEAVLSF